MNRRHFHRMLLSLPGLALLRGRSLAATAPKPSPSLLPIVDTHAHIFERGLPMVAGRRYSPDYDATLSDYLKQLDTHGTSHGVLVQPSFLGTDNRYLVAALKQQPKRLRGIIVVEPTVPGEKLAEFATVGVVGIRLNLVGTDLPDLRTGAWPAFLGRIQRLNWLVEVQRDAKDLPQIVAPLIDAGVNIVVDHFGRPDPTLGVDDPGFRHLLSLAPTRRVWMKLSGSYRNGANGRGEAIADTAVPLLLNAFGASRLLWGSDWPHTQFERVTNYGATRAQLDRWVTRDAARSAVLRTTPAALYQFQFENAGSPVR